MEINKEIAGILDGLLHNVFEEQLPEIGKLLEPVIKEFPIYFKEGFAHYIRNVRLQKTIQLLGQKSLSVQAIAGKTGFQMQVT